MALALISLGTAEYWADRFADAEQRLEQGVVLARRIGRPYLEFTGPAHQAAAVYPSSALAADRDRQADGLAERHGWADDPAVTMACLGSVEDAERALSALSAADREPGEIRIATATLRLARGDPRAATAVLAPVLAGPAPVIRRFWLDRAWVLEAIARDALGDTAAAEEALEHALELAEPNGALLVYWDRRPIVPSAARSRPFLTSPPRPGPNSRANTDPTWGQNGHMRNDLER